MEKLSFPWYHTGIDRVAAEKILSNYEFGDRNAFLVRESSVPNCYALSRRDWKQNGKIDHMLIYKTEKGKYTLKNPKPRPDEMYNSVEELVKDNFIAPKVLGIQPFDAFKMSENFQTVEDFFSLPFYFGSIRERDAVNLLRADDVNVGSFILWGVSKGFMLSFVQADMIDNFRHKVWTHYKVNIVNTARGLVYQVKYPESSGASDPNIVYHSIEDLLKNITFRDSWKKAEMSLNKYLVRGPGVTGIDGDRLRLECALGRYEQVLELLKSGTDINAADCDNSTALVDCLTHTNPINEDLIKLLVEYNTSFEIKEKELEPDSLDAESSKIPMCLAIIKKKYQLVDLFLSRGAKVTRKALILACTRGDSDLLLNLLEHARGQIDQQTKDMMLLAAVKGYLQQKRTTPVHSVPLPTRRLIILAARSSKNSPMYGAPMDVLRLIFSMCGMETEPHFKMFEYITRIVQPNFNYCIPSVLFGDQTCLSMAIPIGDLRLLQLFRVNGAKLSDVKKGISALTTYLRVFDTYETNMPNKPDILTFVINTFREDYLASDATEMSFAHHLFDYLDRTSVSQAVISFIITQGLLSITADDILQVAVKGSMTSIAKRVLKHGASVSGTPNFRPLHGAVETGNLPIVQALITGGASVEDKDSNGMTAYELAEKKKQSTSYDRKTYEEISDFLNTKRGVWSSVRNFATNLVGSLKPQ